MQELECIYDARKSFYGKAKVEYNKTTYESVKDLYSYGTLVASVVCNYEGHYTLYMYYGKYSQTTTRHQKEFFKQCGLLDADIKKLFSDGELRKDW